MITNPNSLFHAMIRVVNDPAAAPEPAPIQDVVLNEQDVFPADVGTYDEFFNSDGWKNPISYFVGRNGSGKSRVATGCWPLPVRLHWSCGPCSMR